VNILRLIFFEGERPTEEHFLTTLLPEPLSPVVEAFYKRERPELSGAKRREVEEDGAIYLDVRGPVYGKGNVVVALDRGYSVLVPVSHVDAVIFALNEVEPKEEQGERFLLLRGMFHLSAIYADDRTELISKLTPHAEAAAIQRTVARADPGIHYDPLAPAVEVS